MIETMTGGMDAIALIVVRDTVVTMVVIALVIIGSVQTFPMKEVTVLVCMKVPGGTDTETDSLRTVHATTISMVLISVVKVGLAAVVSPTHTVVHSQI